MIATIYQAKTHLSKLLHAAEEGDRVLIQRGKNGPVFQIIPLGTATDRSMKSLPAWKKGTRYREEDILAPEWEDAD